MLRFYLQQCKQEENRSYEQKLSRNGKGGQQEFLQVCQKLTEIERRVGPLTKEDGN